MRRLELKYRANHMCYDSKSGHIYISSNTQRILDASGVQLGNVLRYGKYATIRLSEDGRYLALFDSKRKLTLLNTTRPESPVFANRIGTCDEVHIENNISFMNNKMLVFSVQHIIYSLLIGSHCTYTPIYIGDRDKKICENWKKTGYISSLSCNGQVVIALHHCFDPSTTYIVAKYSCESKEIIRELPGEINNWYNHVCVTPNNGICLFSRYHDRPMLYYASFPADFSSPDLQIHLPSVHAPCFSADGKYLTFSVTDRDHPYGDCYLVDATNWTVIEIVRNNIVYNPSFSNDGKFWLVPGKTSYIYQL